MNGRDVLYGAMSSKLHVILLEYISSQVWCTPLAAALLVFPIRSSRLMLPYHVLGGRQIALDWENKTELACYCALLGLDWVFVTACTNTVTCGFVLILDPPLRILLMCRNLRLVYFRVN